MSLPEHPFRQWVDLAQPRLGARAIAASDEFFAAKERLIDPAPPVFIPDRYDDHGKWMDGWESRRRRSPGHDWCVVRLGLTGRLRGFDVDTSHFTGNYPPEISIEAAHVDALPRTDDWVEIVPRSPVKGNSHNYFAVDDARGWNHLRLNIYPDGGVARLRCYGHALPNFGEADFGRELDLAAIENGGRAIVANDSHFGEAGNLIAPGRGVNMGDGWETRRRRTPGHDWAILALGHPGVVERVVVDTAWFKGNYPDRGSLDAALAEPDQIEKLDPDAVAWRVLLPEQKLGPDAVHTFAAELTDDQPLNLVRLNIFPDGGVSRLRLYGRLSR